jgi:NTP pyrophosphatase (non-canonical NTP hydrolase)
MKDQQKFRLASQQFFSIFISHQWEKQLKLMAKQGPSWTNVEYAVDFLHHATEEVVELLRELPRKWWKHEPEKIKAVQQVGSDARAKVLDELSDVFIHLINFMVCMNISKDEITEAIIKKLAYNQVRKDQN